MKAQKQTFRIQANSLIMCGYFYPNDPKQVNKRKILEAF